MSFATKSASAVLAIAVAMLLNVGPTDARGGSAGTSVSVSVTAAFEARTSFSVELDLPAGTAAVDGRAYFDSAAAELIGVAPSGDGVGLAPVSLDGGAAFAAYGLDGQRGNVLHLVMWPLKAGTLKVHFALDGVADVAGRRLALGRAPIRPATAVRDRADGEHTGAAGLDVVRAGWEFARLNGDPCATSADSSGADANDDGCVDAVDLQAVARLEALRSATPASNSEPGARTPTAKGGGGGGPATITVTSTADTPDINPGDGLCADAKGRCTLRAALTTANWNPGEDRIEFNLPGSAPVLIQLSGDPMPIIHDPSGGVFIDGYSQPGSKVNTASGASNAVPGVEIRGTAGKPAGNAFRITSANNTVRGFLLNNLYRPIVMDGEGAHHNLIAGNLIGFNANGKPHKYWANHGVQLNTGAHHNVIGTPAAADRNVIGNLKHAVDLYGPGTDNNVVQNNLLCMTPNGTGKAECGTGIDHNFGPKSNVHGGLGANERNVIGRTRLNGIEVSHGWDPGKGAAQGGQLKWQVNDNRVIGNWIGFRGDGGYKKAFRSGFKKPGGSDNANGVNVYDGTNNTLVANNFIGSAWDGIQTMSTNTTGTVIRNNVIGVSPTGKKAPLKRHGIVVREASKTHVIEGNTIRNVKGHGIALLHKDVLWVRMSGNIMSKIKGQAIFLARNPNNKAEGANNLLASPVVTGATTKKASGTGIAGAVVEVYRAARKVGKLGLPTALLGTTTVAADGTWSVNISTAAGTRVAALQIVDNGNTSGLSLNVKAKK